ncbi:MAG: O-antigen ligase family protein, partial [Candidatus Shapirobacteria bacterium]
ILGVLGLLGILGIFVILKSTLPPTLYSPSSDLLISKSTDIRQVVWRGAVEIGRHYPFFGTGPETFAYSYYWYRPREHNDLSEWDFLYNKAHNEYLNYFATTGIIGLGGYLLLIGGIICFAGASLAPTQIALLLGWISILVTNFFGFSVVITSLFFFLFPAMMWVLNQNKDTQDGRPPAGGRPNSIQQYNSFGIIGLLNIYCLLFTTRYWLADFHYANGVKLNRQQQYALAFNELQNAIELKDEPNFRDEIAWSAANLAVAAQKQGEETLLLHLITTAKKQSDLALKTNPYHVNFWKSRAKIFYKLAEIEPENLKFAAEALTKAGLLAPTDAKIRYHLGVLTGEKKYLDEALHLKPNYTEVQQALENWKEK